MIDYIRSKVKENGNRIKDAEDIVRAVYEVCKEISESNKKFIVRTENDGQKVVFSYMTPGIREHILTVHLTVKLGEVCIVTGRWHECTKGVKYTSKRAKAIAFVSWFIIEYCKLNRIKSL